MYALHNYIFPQIIAEFSRIKGSDMTILYRERWNTLQDKVLHVATAHNDGNSRIQGILQMAGNNPSGSEHN